MLTAIQINDSNYKFETGEVNTEINGLKKINIFVGQNNSGKSRFMRSIFSNKNKKQEISNREEGIDEFNKNLLSIKAYGHIGNGFPDIIRSLKDIQYKNSATSLELERRAFFDLKSHCNTHSQYLKNSAKEGLHDLVKSINEAELLKNEAYKIVYIPLLRGLKNPSINQSKNDAYKERTIYDYYYPYKNNPDNNFEEYLEKQFIQRDFEIFTGLSLYEDIKKMLLGTHDERTNVKDFENFLSDNFFNGEPVTLIPRHKDDVLYIDIGNNKNKAIYDLGDGIQSIIINTFPLFKYKDENLLLFIEEPEMCIHPGMQRILLNTFTHGIEGQKGEHQIYFTTHSNHFLDIALDKEINDQVSIYQFRETEENDEKSITNISQNKEILDLLGVKNSSVFLSNCIIWVEGVSDRIYIKKFLELYHKSKKSQKGFKVFEEDKHFSILEYAGGNITHFNFGEFNDEDTINIEAINKNNFIIADNDLQKSGKKFDRLKELEDLVGKSNMYYDFPEIENLITYDIYSAYFNDYKGINWKKREKGLWKRETFDKNIYKMNIGTILKNSFIELISGKKSEKFIKGNDISIIGKKDEIAERITGLMEEFSHLSIRGKILTKKLYNFIEENNQLK